MMDKKSAAIGELSSKLESLKGFSLNMIIGVDGFVDEIIHVVDKRQDFNNFTRIGLIEELGDRIVKAAGLSANIEFVVQQTKLGGNGPIYSNALIEYGVSLTYIGAIGLPDIHPVFKPMADRTAAVYSLCDPGHTDALEFTDGKLMLGKYSGLSVITWERFKEVLGGADKIAEIIRQCHLFGMENWTMVPNMSGIWEGLINEVFPLLPDKDEKPIAFFDLADPEKRTKTDILNAMALIGKFESKFKTILGLNEKELYEIAAVFGVNENSLKSAAEAVYKKLGVYCLVVHPTKEAICVINNEYYQADGPYCAQPKLTTGAGDNFNAGFCLAQSLGLDPLSSLLLGVSTSGYYVRNAQSPNFENLLNFLRDWQNGNI
ncbi:MAG: carbohydrate kinase family protein [Clostridiales bacterium]|jgi:hypothetical protein|nr:carbohydrate kinase family protein [Clostridiales bacterium]